jgi:hypothetical protein
MFREMPIIYHRLPEYMKILSVKYPGHEKLIAYLIISIYIMNNFALCGLGRKRNSAVDRTAPM